MSLSALNYPPLIVALGAGTISLIPLAEQAIVDGTISFNVVKGANALAYAFSVWSTSRPGRFDSFDEDNSDAAEGMKKMSPGSKGKTLVAPAGWAFAIWGPIFLGELVFVSSQLFLLDESSHLAPIIKNITAPYVSANIFQSLWTASFRPKYGKGFNKYISVANLSGIAYSLSLAHSVYTTGISGGRNSDNSQSSTYTVIEFCQYLLPISLHFGWTTAASLVNLNGMVALEESSSATLVAILGHLSVIGATATGVMVTIDRSAPVFGGVIAWALSAVASGMSQRIKESKDAEDPNRVGVYGARLQRVLAILGAVSCLGASFTTNKFEEKILK